VKLMRLFLFNPRTAHPLKEISERIQHSTTIARRELINLEKMGLIKKRRQSVQRKKGKKVVSRKEMVWLLNDQFPFITQLEVILVNTASLLHNEVLKKLSRVGKLKLVIISGVFTRNHESRVDLLIVGDNLKKRAIQNVIKNIESEVGKELRYATFETTDFNYRISVYDKLIRDILDYPHERLLDKLAVK
jgi:hypothetical protein